MVKYLRQFIFLFTIVIAFSCEVKRANDSASYKNKESISPKPVNDSNFIVKDSSKYARSFLDSLKYSGYAKTYQITDNVLVLNQVDTAIFPVELTIGKTKEFKGSKYGKHFLLTLMQVNYTSIRFGFGVFENSEMIDKQVGYANLQPLFFLGSESDEDDVNGLSYMSTEYMSSNKDCEFAIRVGKNEANELLVKIKLNCNDSKKNIDLNQSPTFRQIENGN